MRKINNHWISIIIILLISAFPILFPILIMGFPAGGADMVQHIKFALTYHDAMANGVFFPGWVPDHIDYGSVGIRFYPPLPYYFLAISKMVVGNWFDAFWINLFGWMSVGCFGIYLFAKDWMSPGAALITSVIYALMPYHLLEIYQYFLYAEFAALCILPFCFLFISRICRERRWIDTLLFTLSYSLLILTHIPLTIIGTICLVVFAMFLTDTRKIINTIKCLVIAFGLSLIATSFYWIKVVSEIHWIALNYANYSKSIFDYSEWLFPISLSEHENGQISNNAGFFDVLIFLNLLLLIPGVIYLTKLKSKDNSERKFILALLLTAFFSFFMTTRLSYPVWHYFSFLQKIQFPWRWISVFSLLGILSLMVALTRLSPLYLKTKRLFIYPLLTLAVSVMIFNISQIVFATDFIKKPEFNSNVEALPGNRSLEPWWTVWTNSQAFEYKEKVRVENRKVYIDKWSTDERQFTIDEGDAATIGVAAFYYPYWKAEINGQPVEVNKDENGLVLLELPGQQIKVRLYFEEPLINKIAIVVSLFLWVGLFLSLGSCFFIEKNKR